MQWRENALCMGDFTVQCGKLRPESYGSGVYIMKRSGLNNQTVAYGLIFMKDRKQCLLYHEHIVSDAVSRCRHAGDIF